MNKVDFVERARDWLHSQLKAMACKVCQNYPLEIDIGDELDDIPSFAMIEHGSGCYTQSENGGGESYVDIDESIVIVAGLLAELEKHSATVSKTSTYEAKQAAVDVIRRCIEICQMTGNFQTVHELSDAISGLTGGEG